MYEEIHFLRETVLDINAAVIGIHSSKWTAIAETEATPDHAATVMSSRRFDVLPVKGKSGVKEYFQTSHRNDFSSITRKTITHRDVLPCTTSLRDLIHRFASEERFFYFLTSGTRIVGLISAANLNCRHVKTYLFSLLSDLEIRLGKFIGEHCKEEELRRMTFESSGKKREEIERRYNADQASGVDVPFTEYLFLSDLFNVISKKKLFGSLGYPSRKQFEEAFGPLNELRNSVAHPNRSLIMDQECVKKLWQRIDQVEEILFLLREV